MAHEGEAQRLDQEALDVEAAAIIEDLRPMEDSEVLPEGGGVGDLASELAAPTEAAPDTASADACVPAGASTSVGVGSAASSAAAPPQLASAVKVCRVHGMHVSTHKKLFLRFSDEHKDMEKALVAALVADGGIQLFGQSSRGAMERKAMDLMQKLGATHEKIE